MGNMPKRHSHSLSPTPLSPTGWYNQTPIFSVMETKTETNTKTDEDPEEDPIMRPILEPIGTLMTIMSEQDTRPRNDSASMTMLSKSVSTDHEFSLSATLSSAMIKTPQVTAVQS